MQTLKTKTAKPSKQKVKTALAREDLVKFPLTVRLKLAAKEQVGRMIVKALLTLSDESIVKIVKLFEKITRGRQHDAAIAVRKAFERNHPSIQMTRERLKAANPVARKKFVQNLLVRGAILNNDKRTYARKIGDQVPTVLLFSPTMRCNLKCEGCYAMNYKKHDDLPFELVDRIITEGERNGVGLFTVLGGEPFVWPHLTKLLSKHPKAYFQVYSNTTVLTEEKIKEIAEIGNTTIITSIEGWEAETDKRRGQGTFKSVMRAMDLLEKYGVPHGASITVTSKNVDTVMDEKFVDMLIDKGVFVAWLFMYMPIGSDPDISLMPTPEQRKFLYEKIHAYRKSKPIIMIDFWNDAPYVEGCIAARDYVHVTSKGDLEPCIFTHWAQNNLKDMSLRDAMKSDFFRAIRREQPYDENQYLPCMHIDHPEVFRQFQKSLDIYETHEGAATMTCDPAFQRDLDEYAKSVRKVYDPIWEQSKWNTGQKPTFKQEGHEARIKSK